jgi:hypothetical protein
MVAGLMDEIDGAGAVAPPPAEPPESEPEAGPELPPPHPFTKAANPKTKARKRTEETQDLHNSRTLSKRPSFPKAINLMTGWIALSNITLRQSFASLLFSN